HRVRELRKHHAEVGDRLSNLSVPGYRALPVLQSRDPAPGVHLDIWGSVQMPDVPEAGPAAVPGPAVRRQRLLQAATGLGLSRRTGAVRCDTTRRATYSSHGCDRASAKKFREFR